MEMSKRQNGLEDSQIVELNSEDDSNHRLTKAERKEKRKAENKKWRVMDRKAWSDIDPNIRHTTYYAMQLPELTAEWKQLQAAMACPLPASFWITKSLGTGKIVFDSLSKRFSTSFKSMRVVGRFWRHI